MNLIREIFFSPMVVDAAGIILIVAACGKAKIISCPAAPQKPRGQICCGQWRPYRLRWQQSAALPASRWPF